MWNFKHRNENLELKIWDLGFENLEFESESFILNLLQEFSFLSFLFGNQYDPSLFMIFFKRRKEKKKKNFFFLGVDSATQLSLSVEAEFWPHICLVSLYFFYKKINF